VAALLAAGCATPSSGPVRWREPGFDPAAVRRPAVLVLVSIERGGFGGGAQGERERAAIPERYELAVLEALDRFGILPLDITLEARPGSQGHERPLEQVNRPRALARARETGAEHLLIVDARLARRDLVHCRESRRPRAGPTTFWVAGLEVLRASDGRTLLVEPPTAERLVTDVELDCESGRVTRRKGMDELVEESVTRILSPLGGS
jgi:hypothetical protein